MASQMQPLSPDAEYCVYCHAIAAGLCAVCGAWCCGDCVELVMGLTRRRAVCRSCLRSGRVPADRRMWVGIALVLPALLLCAGLLLVLIWL